MHKKDISTNFSEDKFLASEHRDKEASGDSDLLDFFISAGGVFMILAGIFLAIVVGGYFFSA